MKEAPFRTDIWIQPWVQELSERAKTLLIYLLSHRVPGKRHTRSFPDKKIEHDLRWKSHKRYLDELNKVAIVHFGEVAVVKDTESQRFIFNDPVRIS